MTHRDGDERDPEIEALLEAERARHAKRIVPLAGVGAAATLGGGAAWWWGHTLTVMQTRSEVLFVLPDVIKIAGVTCALIGVALLATAWYIRDKLKKGEML